MNSDPSKQPACIWILERMNFKQRKVGRRWFNEAYVNFAIINIVN